MRYNILALYAGAGQGTGYPEVYLVLATIRSDKSFPEIQEIPARNAATASPFFVIESVSVGPADGFLIAGNFTGTRQFRIPGSQGTQSLYPCIYQ